ncbi:telomerase Cajal body protein 1-like [Saccostrea echinata]|uniref:telomerase Cajal body protein 1-like n=1 Tax=Saccostrea echinata TaxID=191078 RepID=UPI002A810606|nr:telomerase Cajal body protein 1-like [Saccostrea echinata]
MKEMENKCEAEDTLSSDKATQESLEPALSNVTFTSELSKDDKNTSSGHENVDDVLVGLGDVTSSFVAESSCDAPLLTSESMDVEVSKNIIGLKPASESHNVNTESVEINCLNKQISTSVPTENTASSDCQGSLIQKHTLLTRTEFDRDQYLRGCKWSVDGNMILTTTSDNKFYTYNFAQEQICTKQGFSEHGEWKPTTVISETGTVYDYCWFNQTTDPSFFLTTSKDNPIHNWDANTGQLVSSYRAYNQMDELSAAYSLCYSLDGRKIYCGFNKMIRVFDTDRPGRECESRPTYVGKVGGQYGIISCLAPSPQGGMYAAGSYSRSIGLYYEPQGEAVCVFEGQQGGVTHVAFSRDGTKLFSGGRKDPEILCWDLRNPGQILFVAVRKVETNQRIYFDQDSTGRYLISGNHDGMVTLWDTLQSPVQARPDTDFVLHSCQQFKAHDDTVNGICFHPTLPVFATSSGQRHSPVLDDEDSFSNEILQENTLKLWLYK